MFSRGIYLVKDTKKWVAIKAGGNTEDCDVTDVNVEICFNKKETVNIVKCYRKVRQNRN